MNIVLPHKLNLQLVAKAAEYAAFAISILCMMLFLSSAYDKIADHATFEKGLARVAVIGSYAAIIAWAVPVLEIVIGILLIVPKTQLWGLYAFTALMGIFTLYITGMFFWAEKLPCNCNLLVSDLSFGEHTWFNLGFMALAAIALRFSKGLLSNKLKN